MKNNTLTNLSLLLISLSMVNSASKNAYYDLYNSLFYGYNSEIRPNNDFTINVGIEFSIISLNELREKDQTLVSFGYIFMYWLDDLLSWNESEYNGIQHMVVPQKRVWRPDIVVSNSVEKRTKIGYDELPIRINSDGYLEWEPSHLFQTSCDIDITYYPFDVQVCTIVLETMVSNKYELNLLITQSNVGLLGYNPSGQWDMLNTKLYKKDNEDYSSIYIELKIQRRRTFYVLNLILPILLLSLMGSLTFALPSDAGEKMSLSITVLLAYLVFLTIVSDSMPQTSVQVSLLGVYLTILLSLSTISVLLAIPILRLYHTQSTDPVPSYAAWFVRCRGKCRNRKVSTVSEDAEVPRTQSQKSVTDFDGENVTWKEVSQTMDSFFGILFFLLTFISTIIFMAIMLSNY